MQPIRYGKYELIERIARGGMAEVYKARVKGAAGFQKMVAIKKLHAHLSEDSEMVNMLKDEARLVSNMVHPNICAVLDLDRVEDTYYIAMEYIHGKDISTIARFERSQNRRIPIDIALYIIRQTLTGLDYAHRLADPVSGMPLNIIHRDISPQNIIVGYNGGVKIIDFGIAKAAESLHHTQSGVIKGKFRYMSSEQASGKHIDHRVDIFAAGVVLYEMLMGDVHSRGASDAQLIVQAQTGHFEPLGKLVRDMPLGLELAVMKSLSPDRENRFPSARTFRNALDTIVQREGLEVAPEAVASYLASLFPDPFSKGSRVDEVEQLSARDLQEFSAEVAARSSGGYDPLPPAPGGAPAYNYFEQTNHPAGFGGGPAPMPGPPPAVGPAPGQQYDYYNKNELAAPVPGPPPEVQPPLEPTKTALPKEAFNEVEANPVGLTKATSETGRERRARERREKREEQERAIAEREEAVATKDYGALPPKKRDPWVRPFFDRLVKALGHTFINIMLLFALVGIGAGIYKYTRNQEKQDQTANSKVGKSTKVTKRCTRGLVYLSIKTRPAGAVLFFDGQPTGVKSPVANVEYNMCFNQPLVIRAEKGNLAGEASVNYPLKGKSVSVNIKLSKDKKGHSTVGDQGIQPLSPANTGSHSTTTARKRPSSNENSGTKEKVRVPANAKPAGVYNPDAPEVAGGIGVVKVTCNKQCSPIVDGRAKGQLSFRLRARKAPYIIKVKWLDDTHSKAKKLYVHPYQDNFIRFTK